MLNYGLTGSGVHDQSSRFRAYVVIVFGIFAFGSILYWRSQALVASDYVELPQHEITKKVTAGSKNFQVEYLEENSK